MLFNLLKLCRFEYLGEEVDEFEDEEDFLNVEDLPQFISTPSRLMVQCAPRTGLEELWSAVCDTTHFLSLCTHTADPNSQNPLWDTHCMITVSRKGNLLFDSPLKSWACMHYVLTHLSAINRFTFIFILCQLI